MDGTAADAADRFTSTPTRVATDPARALSLRSGDRWGWWQEAAGAWSDRPVRGWGAGSFPVTHRLYRRDASQTDPPGAPRRSGGWPASGSWASLLGLGGVLALLAAAVVGARRAAVRRRPGRARRAGRPRRGVARARALDSDWDVPGVTLPVLLALGVAAARPGSVRGRDAAPASGRGIAYAGVLCLLLAAAVSARPPGLAASRTASAREDGGRRRPGPGADSPRPPRGRSSPRG